MPVALSAASAAMHGAMVPIAYTSLSSPSYIDMTNIPQTYQDLRIVIYGRSSNASASGDTLRLYVAQGGNFQYGNIYSMTQLKGDGSSAVSWRLSNWSAIEGVNILPTTTQTSGLFASITIDVLNYRGSGNKTLLYRSASDWNGSGQSVLSVGMVANTAAITGFQFATSIGGNHFAAGTTIALYGIRTVGQ